MMSDSSAAKMTCDFCGTNAARWLFVSRFGFLRVLLDHDGTSVLEEDDGRWAACDGCTPHVEERNVSVLVQRALATAETASLTAPSPEERALLTAMLTDRLTLLLTFPMTKRPINEPDQ